MKKILCTKRQKINCIYFKFHIFGYICEKFGYGLRLKEEHYTWCLIVLANFMVYECVSG